MVLTLGPAQNVGLRIFIAPVSYRVREVTPASGYNFVENSMAMSFDFQNSSMVISIPFIFKYS